VYDKSTTNDLGGIIWDYLRSAEHSGKELLKTEVCEGVVNHVLMQSMKKMSYDNLTGIFLQF